MNSHKSKAYEIVSNLLKQRAGKFSPLKKIFQPYIDELVILTGLDKNASIDALIFNSLNYVNGPGHCEICNNVTKLYPQRGGWAKFCSKKCMNSAHSSRYLNSEKTKSERNTHINSKDTRKKIKNTFVEKYNVTNPSKIAEVKLKREETFKAKFGETTPFKNEKVKRKIKETLKSKFGGQGCASTQILTKINATKRLKIFSSLSTKIEKEWDILTDAKEWTGSHSMPIEIKHKCGTEIKKYMWCGQHLFSPRCPKCDTSSIPQQKIINLLYDGNIDKADIKINDRTLIAPLEIDIVIPSKKIAIEINGLYFHGEKSGKPKNYHLIKTEKMEKLGYQLLHFTDYEIANKFSAVTNLLFAKLNLHDKIYARNTFVEEISHLEAKQFLETYHIQGSCRSTYKLGLFYKDKLVAVMTFGRSRFCKGEIELLRFASMCSVVGGASKLISAFMKKTNCKNIVSYADRRWSSGAVYKKLGFTLEKVTSPGYWYFKGNQFHHRTKFQKHKIKNIENSHLSEWKIMLNNGWDRIWDCGNLKFRLNN